MLTGAPDAKGVAGHAPVICNDGNTTVMVHENVTGCAGRSLPVSLSVTEKLVELLPVVPWTKVDCPLLELSTKPPGDEMLQLYLPLPPMAESGMLTVAPGL